MSRLTITLTEPRYRALKEASAKRGKTIGQLIDESLEFFGVKTRTEASELVARARAHANMSEEDAQDLANREVRAARQGKK